jgi:hypothetical protein
MINDQKIEVVEKYKYLGVILAYIIINGNLKHAADQLFDREEEEIPLTSEGFLFDLLGILDFDFSSMKLKLFDTLIKPIVTYAYASRDKHSNHKNNLETG